MFPGSYNNNLGEEEEGEEERAQKKEDNWEVGKSKSMWCGMLRER